MMTPEDYRQTFQEKLQMERLISISFLKTHVFGTDILSNQAIKNVIYKFEKVQFGRGQYVFRQGDAPKGLYIVINGEVQVRSTLFDSAIFILD